MYVRVVRFTDVDAGRVQELVDRIDESDGPPEGLPMNRLTMLVDEDQRTAVVLQYFDTAEDLATGAEMLNAMDPSETPGTRASIDTCEVKLEVQAP